MHFSLINIVPLAVALGRYVYKKIKKLNDPESLNTEYDHIFEKTPKRHSKVVDLYNSQESDMIITDRGIVERVLTDGLNGDRHQRFIVRINNEITVLIAHNIDIAKRVRVKSGDPIKFKGEYEWNEYGGTIHWTHRDPKGWRDDGWLEVNGKRTS